MRKLKGIILVVLLIASVLMPFNIYADTLITTSNITGCHITDVDFSDSTAYNNITCNMDSEYYGYANMTIQYYVGSSNTATSQAYYITVSGNSFDAVISTSNTSINRQKTISVIQVNDNHIYLKDDMNYDDIMWQFPLESYGFIAPMMYRNYELVSINQYGTYYIPTIKLYKDNILLETYLGADENNMAYIIFISKKNYPSVTDFLNDFDIGSLTVNNIGTLQLLGSYRLYGRIYKVQFFNNTGSSNYFTIKAKQTVEFMPIYYNRKIDEPYGYANVGTDFALTFKIQNELLYNLGIVANGTSGSQSSVTDVNSQNQQFESDRDDLIDIEDNFNEDMNDKLDVIDTNTGVSGFGGYFINSAVWVRTQFDRLTNNTPYGSLIVYGMTLGLALLLLGKVFL